MIKSQVVLAASAVFLSTALAASYFFQNREADIKPNQVLTWDCGYSAYKPETIMIHCADGGAYISKVKWKTWSKDGASGTGEYYRNLCEPDCADGQIVHAPVGVRLSELIPRKGKFYLRTLDMSSITGKDFPWGESSVREWEVMEIDR